MASAGVAPSEPEFLAARRERAAGLTETLELPQFKGNAGWEFTDISSLDLTAYGPAPEATNGAAPAPLVQPRGIGRYLSQCFPPSATRSGG